VKKFREERELSVVLLVDASSSGRFGTRDRFKSEVAAELCALLAFSAIKNSDKVGLIIFTDRIEKFVPPKKGRSHVLRLIREVLFFQPQGVATDIGMALEYLSKVIKRKSVVFLVSDFFFEDYTKPLQVANKKHDIIAMKICDPRERVFEDVGLIELEDTETGEVVLINTGSKEFRREFAARADEDLQNLKRSFKLVNMDFINIQTDQSYIAPLVSFFKMREKRH
ncbi:MAG: VWA domain-containing protein, partial [candidate division Zixibacteria bacterium]|nr:VWA domain-containing protein [candidate division Zixibacteria bacterium]